MLRDDPIGEPLSEAETEEEESVLAEQEPLPAPEQYCKCGFCKQMPTEEESFCCGGSLGGCIIEHSLLNDLIKPESLEINLRQHC